jgi:hypothetical protein
MTEQPRTYVTMADKSIGKCSSGHWLPLKGDCDLCGAGPDQKCRYADPADRWEGWPDPPPLPRSP